MTMIIDVKTYPPNGSYRIHVKRGIFKFAGRILSQLNPGGKLVVLTSRRIRKLWLDDLEKSLRLFGMNCMCITIADGEKYKNFDTYKKIITQLTAYHIDRYSTLLTLGGGVIGDLGGYVAATYKRGINLVHVPTTLIAQIDSSIGGKVAIDLERGKNLIGSFYNPGYVLTDPDLLCTLSDREFINGLFEAIKIALVSNPELFISIRNNLNKLLKRRKTVVYDLVRQCVCEKVKVVEADPYDLNLRAILNFGHTFGHALETRGGYKAISHGQAVGWGMLLAFNLSSVIGRGRQENFAGPIRLLRRLLSDKKPGRINGAEIWETMRHDKKAQNGQVQFILLEKIGRPVIAEINRRQFIKALEML
ncbi:MAG: 3-dehydroquinate synthase [Candidatus Zixiibacteriota bacterium]|nr:MAG: 3-dehydroquinate synthase [candidate division Zixibacteria bacterium]